MTPKTNKWLIETRLIFPNIICMPSMNYIQIYHLCFPLSVASCSWPSKKPWALNTCSSIPSPRVRSFCPSSFAAISSGIAQVSARIGPYDLATLFYYKQGCSCCIGQFHSLSLGKVFLCYNIQSYMKSKGCLWLCAMVSGFAWANGSSIFLIFAGYFTSFTC